jgi:cytochrome c oxidase subunit 2
MGNWLGLPLLASVHGAKIDRLIVMVHLLMVLMFIGWGLFFVYCLFRFRKKKHPAASHDGAKSHASSWIEAAIVLIEIALLVGFSIPFWIAEVDALPKPEEDPFEVRVIAQQFLWTTHYPGADGVFGRTRVDLVDDETNPLGLDRSDPAADDDIVSKILRLPAGRPALIRLTSRDVIHSFAVPEFRVKQDAIPGMSIPVHFTPTMTTAQLRQKTGVPTRNFEIMCSQLCGLGHYRMQGLVMIEPEADVAAWLKEKASEN